jgi:hypothetical protein
MFVAGFQLAVDINDYDLYMDVHHAAMREVTIHHIIQQFWFSLFASFSLSAAAFNLCYFVSLLHVASFIVTLSAFNLCYFVSLLHAVSFVVTVSAFNLCYFVSLLHAVSFFATVSLAAAFLLSTSKCFFQPPLLCLLFLLSASFYLSLCFFVLFL